MTESDEFTLPKPPAPARVTRGAARWTYRLLVLPLTMVYLVAVGAGLLVLAWSALRALLSAAGVLEGGAFDWLPD